MNEDSHYTYKTTPTTIKWKEIYAHLTIYHVFYFMYERAFMCVPYCEFVVALIHVILYSLNNSETENKTHHKLPHIMLTHDK